MTLNSSFFLFSSTFAFAALRYYDMTLPKFMFPESSFLLSWNDSSDDVLTIATIGEASLPSVNFGRSGGGAMLCAMGLLIGVDIDLLL